MHYSKDNDLPSIDKKKSLLPSESNTANNV